MDSRTDSERAAGVLTERQAAEFKRLTGFDAKTASDIAVVLRFIHGGDDEPEPVKKERRK
jgi:hypothetical protein